MRTIILAALAATLVVTLAPSVGATHSGKNCPTYNIVGLTGQGILNSQVGVNPSFQLFVSTLKDSFYIVNDAILTGDWVTSFWIYEESNGAGGLQREDDYCYTEGYGEPHLVDALVW